MVQFGNALSIADQGGGGLGTARTLRKVSRILRVHFQRARTAAIGPDLSHRRTVIEKVLNSPPVRRAIEEQAKKDKSNEQKAEKEARSVS